VLVRPCRADPGCVYSLQSDRLERILEPDALEFLHDEFHDVHGGDAQRELAWNGDADGRADRLLGLGAVAAGEHDFEVGKIGHQAAP
jgi:hypothetical protein